MLQTFRLVGFKVEDADNLKNAWKDFKNLKELNISLYDCQDGSSSDEEEDEDDNGLVGKSNVEVVSFFLQSAVNLEASEKSLNSQKSVRYGQVVKLHMDFGTHLNFSYLASLLDKNPLLYTSHLHISRLLSPPYILCLVLLFSTISQKTVQLGEEAVGLVLARLPAVISLKVSPCF